MSDCGFDYDDMAQFAQDMIDANGQAVTVTRVSRTPADNTKPWRGPVTSGADGPEIISTTAVIIPNLEKDDKDQNPTKRGDATAYIAAMNFEDGSPLTQKDLELFDTLEDASGMIWHIVSADILNPGGERILYTVQMDH